MAKFFKKLAKKNEGFTLVELIVVIAILGILAAVAVPAYTGYINKANEAADITELDAIKTAVIAYNAEKGAVTSIEVGCDSSGKVNSVTSNQNATSILAEADFQLFMTGTAGTAVNVTLTSDTFKTGAEWAGTEWTKLSND